MVITVYARIAGGVPSEELNALRVLLAKKIDRGNM